MKRFYLFIGVIIASLLMMGLLFQADIVSEPDPVHLRRARQVEATATNTLTGAPAVATPTSSPMATEDEGEEDGTPTGTLTLEAGAAAATVTPTPLPPFIQVQPRLVVRTLASRLLRSVVILLIAWPAAVLLRVGITKLFSAIQANVRVFLGQIAFLIVWIVAIMGILNVFEVQSATLTAIVGSVGLALSLSSQDLFKNFIAGIYLLMERPFSVGDEITLGGHTGIVQFIDLRTTVILKPDQERVIVPNTLVMSQVVVRRDEKRPPMPGAEEASEEEGV